MRELGINPDDADTFVFVSDGEALTRFDAVLALTRHLRAGWQILRLFRIVPRPVRNWAYGVVARNRFRWFGRYDTCMVPAAEVRDRFIID